MNQLNTTCHIDGCVHPVKVKKRGLCRAHYRQWYYETRKPKGAASAKDCAVCGTSFVGKTERAKYCTQKCRERAAYEKSLTRAPKCPRCNGPWQRENESSNREFCNKCYADTGTSRTGKTRECYHCGERFPSKSDKDKGTCTKCFQAMKAAGVRACTECGRAYPWMRRAQCGTCRHTKDSALYYRDCANCGKAFTTQDNRTANCSLECGQANRRTVDLKSCGTDILLYNAELVETIGEYQQNINSFVLWRAAKRRAHASKSKRSPMRAAYEDGDMPGLIAAIKTQSNITPEGCWEWGRRKDKGGYGKVQWAGKNHAVHRLAALAKYGQPESEPVVHHKCANAPCCNPDHLQPISQRENMAEMLERNYYLKRISELESALSRVDPTNSALKGYTLTA